MNKIQHVKYTRKIQYFMKKIQNVMNKYTSINIYISAKQNLSKKGYGT